MDAFPAYHELNKDVAMLIAPYLNNWDNLSYQVSSRHAWSLSEALGKTTAPITGFNFASLGGLVPRRGTTGMNASEGLVDVGAVGPLGGMREMPPLNHYPNLNVGTLLGDRQDALMDIVPDHALRLNISFSAALDLGSWFMRLLLGLGDRSGRNDGNTTKITPANATSVVR